MGRKAWGKREKITITLSALAVMWFFFFLLDLSHTFYIKLSFMEALNALFGNGRPEVVSVIQRTNLPRVLMACFVGAGLGVAGAVMQGVFKNPMASPYILGLSSGASVGAALSMTFTIALIPSLIYTPIMSFIFCVATLFLVYSISRVGGRVPTETLLLSGIAVGSFLSAIVSLLTYMAGDQMQGIVYWTMGNLTNATLNNVVVVAPLILFGLGIMILYSKELNAIMLGDAHAMDLGVDVKRTRLILLVASAIVTAAAVSFVGTIGFVGLVVPHILRILLGPDNRLLIPASAVGGATFLTLCDYLSRVISPSIGIIPIGIITALIGAPYFIYLLRKRKDEVGWN